MSRKIIQHACLARSIVTTIDELVKSKDGNGKMFRALACISAAAI